MITIDLKGGIGNALFQVFAAISTGIRTGHDVKFMYHPETVDNPRPPHWNDVFRNIRDTHTVTHIELMDRDISIINHGKCQYKPVDVPKNTGKSDKRLFILSGCFQTDKYFHTEFVTVSKLLGISDMQSQIMAKIRFDGEVGTACTTSDNIHIVVPQNVSFEHSIGMHFRLGDYKIYSHCHPVLPYDYYRNSLRFMLNRKFGEGEWSCTSSIWVMYFCDEEDIEFIQETIIPLLVSEFPEVSFLRMSHKNISDWDQLLLMSLCTHNIIANSTFSWWAGYINAHSPDVEARRLALIMPRTSASGDACLTRCTEKLVCFPRLWVGPSMPLNTSDICPREWYCIDEHPDNFAPIPDEEQLFYF